MTSDHPRCLCGAFAEHTQAGIDCDACGESYRGKLDLIPAGYEYIDGQWQQQSDEANVSSAANWECIGCKTATGVIVYERSAELWTERVAACPDCASTLDDDYERVMDDD